MTSGAIETLAQSGGGGGGAGGLIIIVIYLAILVVVIAGMWKTFTKAGKPGWACIVPFYNSWVLVKIVNRPVWLFVLLIIPYVNVIGWIIASLDLAKSFGKGVGFAIGIIFLPFIFIPILGFGSATYTPIARA